MKHDVIDDFSNPTACQSRVVSLANMVKTMPQQHEIIQLRSNIGASHGVEEMVSSSPLMVCVRDLIRQAAPSDVTVLIRGESGAGKELVARALHRGSPRASKPFVDVNCAALTETLIESEIFGYERGAFTGAISRHRGKFEQAHGGTIFLDEIGDLPLATQAKMLRVLEERSFQRIAGEENVNVDVRVICATNHSLEDALRKGFFRMDLLYRINILVIEVPPLRERPADIPELAQHFLAMGISLRKHSAQRISEAALMALRAHDWPGNVRELKNAIERAVIVCDEEEIQPVHLPPAVICPSGPTSHRASDTIGARSLVEIVAGFERAMILHALEKNDRHKSRTAAALKVTRRILGYKMKTLGID
jgi:DNA-binding NtrC family response regulator